MRRGAIVVFPTDTVYGIGADPASPEAIARIFFAKGRPLTKPLSLHLASVDEALEYVDDPLAARRVRRLLPGPVTVIVRRPPWVSEHVTVGLPTVGLRVPDHPLCRSILERAGPLAATSANLSSFPAYTGGDDGADLPDADLFVDAGPTPHRGESTIIDLSTSPPRLLREGVISVTSIEAIVGPVTRPYPSGPAS